jgi:2-methylcitrate dehydratase PrpD
MADPAVLRERAKVNLVSDAKLSEFLPVRVAFVEIELMDGSVHSEHVAAVRGTPRNPMSRTEVINKASDITGPVLGREKSERLIEMTYTIETVPDVRSLRPFLRATNARSNAM